MSATILDYNNLYSQIKLTDFFTKVKEASKTDWNLNNHYTDYRLFELNIESVDVSIADLTNKINNLLYSIEVSDDDITELKNLCTSNNITYVNHFFEKEQYQQSYYDHEKDVLVGSRPHNGYILNDKNEWVAPTPIPQEGPVGLGSTGVYAWDGSSLSWEVIYPSTPS